MTALFITILNMSAAASVAALAVIIVRIPLKKAPKIFSYALWGVVLFRLICPFSIESVFSLMPASANAIPQDIVYSQNPAIQTGIEFIDISINTAINNALPPVSPENTMQENTNSVNNANPIHTILQIFRYVWFFGFAALLIYAATGYIRLKRSVCDAILVQKNIFETDKINTPFVLGFIRPKIYMPIGIEPPQYDYILKHEQTHIKRRDYLIKPFAFIVFALHWFNPLMWAAYFFMSKDMEMSCDEIVLRKADEDIRGDYSISLLNLSVKKFNLLTPLAFGESNVKERVRNVLNFKKPSKTIIILAVALVAMITVAFAMNRVNNELPNLENIQRPTGLYGEFSDYRIGFTSAAEGWFIGNYGAAAGKQENYIYLSHDRGKTWQETGNVNEEWARVLTCGGFSSDKTGFLCFRYDIENMGRIYCTNDGGITWELLNIPLFNELVGGGIGEAREISFGSGKTRNTVNITYFASNTGADSGEVFYINGKWNGTDWDFVLSDIQPEKPIELVFHEIVLTFPEEWRNNCSYNYENADFITVYHIKTREAYTDGGVLFYLSRVERFSEEDKNEFIKNTPSGSILYETAGYTYIISLPTDVQYLTPNIDRYDKAAADEYLILASQITEIKRAITVNTKETDNQGFITFPANDKDKTEFNASIYEIEPFNISITLPDGWTLKERDDSAFNLLSVWSVLHIINNNSEIVGAIGYNTYELYEGAEDSPQAIYGQIALGNNYYFDVRDSYEVVKETDSGKTAVLDVYYSANINNGTEKINKGIVSYDKDLLVYIAIELADEQILKDDYIIIAQSIEFSHET